MKMPFILPFSPGEVNGFPKNLYDKKEEKNQKLLGYGGIGGKICFFLKYWRLDVILLQNCYNFTKQEVRKTKEKTARDGHFR